MSGSTFTISNLGMFGVDHFTAIINPPNAAILAVGQAIEKPFVEQDEDGDSILVVGHEMSMTMSSDHRIIDGRHGGRISSDRQGFVGETGLAAGLTSRPREEPRPGRPLRTIRTVDAHRPRHPRAGRPPPRRTPRAR